jgi:hypothetical protein
MIDQHQTTLRRRQGSRLLLAVAVSLALSLLVGVPDLRQGQVDASTARGSTPSNYLGTWNYDMPDRVTMRNVATASCSPSNTKCSSAAQHGRSSPSFKLPQIGYVTFSQTSDGAIIGHTDQGCTWRFEPGPRSLELTPPSQSCFNHVIGSGYTITRWSVTVSGRRERETIAAVSHLPIGDYDFLLGGGRRTKVPDKTPHTATGRFVGRWTYDAPDPRSQVNIVTTQESGPGGVVALHSPKHGVVTFTPRGSDALTARTEDGCTWTLVVRGNTAELAPAVQTCQRTNSTIIFRFWSIASDGRHQDTIIAGSEDGGGSTSNFSLSIGALTKQEG